MVDNPGAGGGGGGDVSDDGLWSPGKRDAAVKSEEQPWAVPEAIKGEVPHKPAELVREGAAAGDQGFFSFAFVVLVVLGGGIFVVWKKNKKDRRRES